MFVCTEFSIQRCTTAPALPIAAKMASSRAGLTPREGRGGFTGRNLDKTMTKYLQALEAS